MKRSEKGEIATLLAIGAMIVVAVSAITSSFFVNQKQSTSTRAADNTYSACDFDTSGCGGNPTYFALCATPLSCVACTGSAAGQYKCKLKSSPTATSTLPKPSATSSVPKPSATTAPVPTAAGMCGSGHKWTCDSKQGYDPVSCKTTDLEFRCCYFQSSGDIVVHGCNGTHCSAYNKSYLRGCSQAEGYAAGAPGSTINVMGPTQPGGGVTPLPTGALGQKCGTAQTYVNCKPEFGYDLANCSKPGLEFRCCNKRLSKELIVNGCHGTPCLDISPNDPDDIIACSEALGYSHGGPNTIVAYTQPTAVPPTSAPVPTSPGGVVVTPVPTNIPGTVPKTFNGYQYTCQSRSIDPAVSCTTSPYTTKKVFDENEAWCCVLTTALPTSAVPTVGAGGSDIAVFGTPSTGGIQNYYLSCKSNPVTSTATCSSPYNVRVKKNSGQYYCCKPLSGGAAPTVGAATPVPLPTEYIQGGWTYSTCANYCSPSTTTTADKPVARALATAGGATGYTYKVDGNDYHLTEDVKKACLCVAASGTTIIVAGWPAGTSKQVPATQYTCTNQGDTSSTIKCIVPPYTEKVYDLNNKYYCCIPGSAGGGGGGGITPGQPTSAPDKTGWVKMTCKEVCAPDKTSGTPNIEIYKSVPGPNGGLIKYQRSDGTSIPYTQLHNECQCGMTEAQPGTENKKGTFFTYNSCVKQYDCSLPEDKNKTECTDWRNTPSHTNCADLCTPNNKECYMNWLVVEKPFLYCCESK